ncbi:Fe-S-containing hydro-lyase [Tepidibacillus sp. LV47]|uniref:Fe-S-containing hydro-lyase n=1 Tax=Tepidibacillus sp. LV47 TaxID=3398228 RepID=UPI003AB0D691
MATIHITTPVTAEEVSKLKVGDQVLISGVIYTARDAAHKRLVELVEQGQELPFDIKDQFIYFVGPTPAKPGQVIGSAGPTTSYRMDKYSPTLLDLGLRGMIGKGSRSQEVKDSMVKNKAVYLAAVGGAAALIAKTIKSAEVIAYEDLGTEAIRKLVVENFPAIVVNDVYGNDLYIQGAAQYRIDD